METNVEHEVPDTDWLDELLKIHSLIRGLIILAFLCCVGGLIRMYTYSGQEHFYSNVATLGTTDAAAIIYNLRGIAWIGVGGVLALIATALALLNPRQSP